MIPTSTATQDIQTSRKSDVEFAANNIVEMMRQATPNPIEINGVLPNVSRVPSMLNLVFTVETNFVISQGLNGANPERTANAFSKPVVSLFEGKWACMSSMNFRMCCD